MTDWQPTRWWRVIARDGSLWCESSDKGECQSKMRPDDTLQQLWERVEKRELWYTAPPEQPYGPGAWCGTCGHFAARHDETGCHCEDLIAGGQRTGDCTCKVFTWMGYEWPRPWLSIDDGGMVAA